MKKTATQAFARIADYCFSNFKSQFHHALHLQILIPLGAMGGEIDGGIVLDELINTVEGLAGGLDILEDDTEFIGFQGSIAVGHIAVEHIEQALVFDDDDAIAEGMPFGLNEIDTFHNLFAGWEVVIGTVLVSDADNVFLL